MFFVFVLINLTVIVGVRGDKECLCCSGPKLVRWLTGIFVPVILGCRYLPYILNTDGVIFLYLFVGVKPVSHLSGGG
jgi:hypothetical protein